MSESNYPVKQCHIPEEQNALVSRIYKYIFKDIRIQILYFDLFKVFHMGGNPSHVPEETEILKFCSFFQPKFLIRSYHFSHT